MNRIQNLSMTIRVIGQIIFYLALISAVIGLIILTFGSKIDFIKNTDVYLFEHKVNLSSLGSGERILLDFAIVLTTVIYLFGLYHFIKLFKLFEQGEIFTKKTVRQYKMLGWVCILYFPISVLVQLAIWWVILLMKFESPLRIHLIFKDFNILIIGIAVILISWVMDEAKKLKDEQDLTV